MKRAFRSAAALLLAAVALGLAVRQVPLQDAIVSLQRVSPLPLLLALAILAAALWTKVRRWSLLLRPRQPLPRQSLPQRALWNALLIGYLGNVVLPARLGEVVRGYILAEQLRLPLSSVLATIGVEKVLDVGAIMLFLFGLSLTMPLPTWAARAGWLGGPVFALLLLGLVLGVLAGERLLGWVERVRARSPAWLARLAAWEWLRSLVSGLRPLRSPAVAVPIIGWSLLSWVLGALVNLAVLYAFGISPLFPAAVLTMVATNLGMALPSAPGYIGVHHYLSMLALSAFQVRPSLAFGYAVVVHLLIFGTFAMGGAGALLAGGLNLGSLYRRASVGKG